MLNHPITQLLLNPFAGTAGFNLISAAFYTAIVLLALAVVVEWLRKW